MLNPKVLTVIMKDGRMMHALEDITSDDAVRWTEEGAQVFRIVVHGKNWAVNHVNSGKVFQNDPPGSAGGPGGVGVVGGVGAFSSMNDVQRLLNVKGE